MKSRFNSGKIQGFPTFYYLIPFLFVLIAGVTYRNNVRRAEEERLFIDKLHNVVREEFLKLVEKCVNINTKTQTKQVQPSLREEVIYDDEGKEKEQVTLITTQQQTQQQNQEEEAEEEILNEKEKQDLIALASEDADEAEELEAKTQLQIEPRQEKKLVKSDTLRNDVEEKEEEDASNEEDGGDCARATTFVKKKPASQNAGIVLASYPGSGNTWVRKTSYLYKSRGITQQPPPQKVRNLIQKGSGYWTGSMYNDTTLKQEFAGESIRDDRVIVVKTHHPCGLCWTFVNKRTKKEQFISEASSGFLEGSSCAIVVLRNPFESILSEFNRKFSNLNHTGVAPEEMFTNGSFAAFFKKSSAAWVKSAKYYMRKREKESKLGERWEDAVGRKVLLVLYDKLKSDLKKQMMRMFEFIKTCRPTDFAELSSELASECAIKRVQKTTVFLREKKKLAVEPLDVEVKIEREEEEVERMSIRQFGCSRFKSWWRKEWKTCEVKKKSKDDEKEE